MTNPELLQRAREYVKHGYLDPADVKSFIVRLIELEDENKNLRDQITFATELIKSYL